MKIVKIEFASLAKECAKAVNRQQLDQPARRLAALSGTLVKDTALAAAGLVGGVAGSKVVPTLTPKVEAALTKAYGAIKTTGSQVEGAFRMLFPGFIAKMLFAIANGCL